MSQEKFDQYMDQVFEGLRILLLGILVLIFVPPIIVASPFLWAFCWLCRKWADKFWNRRGKR